MSSPFGRTIRYGGDPRCPHSGRLLGAFICANGLWHVHDWCCLCGGRSEAISRPDLDAAGIDWRVIPVMRDNTQAAA